VCFDTPGRISETVFIFKKCKKFSPMNSETVRMSVRFSDLKVGIRELSFLFVATYVCICPLD